MHSVFFTQFIKICKKQIFLSIINYLTLKNLKFYFSQIADFYYLVKLIKFFDLMLPNFGAQKAC